MTRVFVNNRFFADIQEAPNASQVFVSIPARIKDCELVELGVNSNSLTFRPFLYTVTEKDGSITNYAFINDNRIIFDYHKETFFIQGDEK